MAQPFSSFNKSLTAYKYIYMCVHFHMDTFANIYTFSHKCKYLSARTLSAESMPMMIRTVELSPGSVKK